MSKIIINQSVIPGTFTTDPRDGIVCIHLFVQDEKGPFVEPHVLHPAPGNEPGQRGNTGLIVTKPTRGRLACDPKRLVEIKVVKGITNVTHRTSAPEAVTCPKCKETADFIRMIKQRTENTENQTIEG